MTHGENGFKYGLREDVVWHDITPPKMGHFLISLMIGFVAGFILGGIVL